MKTDLHYRGEDVAQCLYFLTVYVDIRWSCCVKNSVVIENIDFQCFRMLNLRNLRKSINQSIYLQ